MAHEPRTSNAFNKKRARIIVLGRVAALRVTRTVELRLAHVPQRPVAGETMRRLVVAPRHTV